jgi:hypothetical protein
MTFVSEEVNRSSKERVLRFCWDEEGYAFDFSSAL